MNKVLEVDLENQRAVVEPGVFNLDLQNELSQYGYYYAPDPASQKVSTMGGNLGENSGGPHCLKYGVTTNHVLGAEVVLPNGEVIWTGGKACDNPGYDLIGVLVGSEGTFGIATKLIKAHENLKQSRPSWPYTIHWRMRGTRYPRLLAQASFQRPWR
jgi:glycolate oxidase